jgi:hypothetical protein
MRIARVALARLGHRRVGRHALVGGLVDRLVLSVAPIDQKLAWSHARTLLDLLEHRHREPLSASRRVQTAGFFMSAFA